MTTASAPPTPGPPYRRPIRLSSFGRELWGSRELVRTLAERDLRTRYKQAALGFTWAVLTPVALVIILSLVFQHVARIDTGDVPYPLFAYMGLVPWTFFSSAVTLGGSSLVANSALLNKVYCPREVFPLSSIAVAAVDTILSASALLLLFAFYQFAPRASVIWLPPLVAVLLVFTFAVVLIISSVLVYLRDLRHALPILLQLGLFASPIAYGIEKIPSSWRLVYAALNPLVPVVDGFRRTVLYGRPPDWPLVAAGATSSILLALVGYTLFKRLETGFADVA